MTGGRTRTRRLRNRGESAHPPQCTITILKAFLQASGIKMNAPNPTIKQFSQLQLIWPKFTPKFGGRDGR